MKERVRELMTAISILFELLVAVLLVAALFAALLGLVQSLSPAALVEDPELFSEFMGMASALVIGVEFVNMLCNHSMGAVIEIMLLAIARQMIVNHTSPLENLLAVLSVGLLYLFRKYLYIPSLDKKTTQWIMKVMGRSGKAAKSVNPLDEQID